MSRAWNIIDAELMCQVLSGECAGKTSVGLGQECVRELGPGEVARDNVAIEIGQRDQPLFIRNSSTGKLSVEVTP
jgi:hypothetical protein